MKIGIVGGTFNPIHVGHLMLGEYAYEELHLDEIWYMPNGNPPHKSIDNHVITNETRVVLTQIAIRDIPYFKYSSFEIEQDIISYSYQSLECLKVKYPTHEYYFILGSDSLFEIETWKYPNRFMSACHILVACRENMDLSLLQEQIIYLKEKYQSDITLLPMPLLEISSSDIRSRVKAGKSIKYIVPEGVEKYIYSHKLYR